MMVLLHGKDELLKSTSKGYTRTLKLFVQGKAGEKEMKRGGWIMHDER